MELYEKNISSCNGELDVDIIYNLKCGGKLH